MAQLIQLGSGDWIPPSAITEIHASPTHDCYEGRTCPSVYVRTHLKSGCFVCRFEDFESAEAYRDELAQMVNELAGSTPVKSDPGNTECPF